MSRGILRSPAQLASDARLMATAFPSRRRAIRERLGLLVEEFEPGSSARPVREQLDVLQRGIDVQSDRDIWFAAAVLTASLPLRELVTEVMNRAKLDGAVIALSRQLGMSGMWRLTPIAGPKKVEIARDAVLVDVDHTSHVDFATGIQRVVRLTVQRWDAEQSLTLVGWHPDRTGLRRLTPAQRERALGLPRVSEDAEVEPVAVIPHGGRYLLPELNLDHLSLSRIAALAEFSGLETGAIGYDVVPIASSETTNTLVSGRYAFYLSAVKVFSSVVAISVAAGVEWSGWRRMLAGSGVSGPSVGVVVLPSEPPAAVGGVSGVVLPGVVAGVPLVVCVGSHEPRKNHGAVVQAAEVLWREGLVFSLVFVGGNAWGDEGFRARVAQLQGRGRSLTVVSAVDDAVLVGLLRAARFTVFPSLNEGFGLPVVESLAVGTPVVTSGFGSMREIVDAGGGGVLVDPRDDDDVARGMRSLLVDDVLVERLRSEAIARPVRTWDQYAHETWTALTSNSASAVASAVESTDETSAPAGT